MSDEHKQRISGPEHAQDRTSQRRIRNTSGDASPRRTSRSISPAPTQAVSISQTGTTSLKVVLSTLSILVLVLSGIGYGLVGRVGGDLASVTDLALGDGSKGFKQGTYSDGALDILLVGSDSRTDAQGNSLSESELAALHAGVDGGEENTDTIMVIRIPADGSRATAVSIPRDTYIHDGDNGNMKINGVYSTHAAQIREEMTAQNTSAEAAGKQPTYTQKEIETAAVSAGRAALLEQVKDLTGISIDHYAEVGLVGFVLLTDAVGGVQVCLNEPVDDEFSGANFPAGVQTLNGAQGLAYVRQRHGLPRGDLDRIVRQQTFAASLVNNILSSGTLTNPTKLSGISKAVERSVVIDANWDVMSLVKQLSTLKGGNVTFQTIPVTSIDGTGDYGESIVTVDREQVHTFFDNLAQGSSGSEEATPAAATSSAASQAGTASADVAGIGVHVLNAGTTTGLASGVASWLTAQGYNIAEVANATPGLYSTSQVLAADAQDPRAIDLANRLGGVPVVANSTLDSSSLIVVTADNYAGPKDATGSASQSATAASSTTKNVGTPGADLGQAAVAPEIDAGGDSPRCVN